MSLELEVGRIVGLIGPNGSGKTTLLNVIAGADPDAGSVVIDDRETTGWPAHKVAACRGRANIPEYSTFRQSDGA